MCHEQLMKLLIKFTGFKPTAILTHVIFLRNGFYCGMFCYLFPLFTQAPGWRLLFLKKWRENSKRINKEKQKNKSTKVWNRPIARTSFLKICVFEVSSHKAHSLRAGDTAQWWGALLPSLMAWASVPVATCYKEKASSFKVSSVLRVRAVCCGCTCSTYPCLKNNNKTTYPYFKGHYLLPEEMLFAQRWKIASNTTNWLLAWSTLVCWIPAPALVFPPT